MYKPVLLLSIIIILSLSGCTALSDSADATITTDNIEPSIMLEEVIAALPEDKVYPYFWVAENPDKTIEIIKSDDRYKEMNEALNEVEYKEFLIDQSNLDFIITPEEAANLAGNIFEEAYGLSFDEQNPVYLTLESDGIHTFWTAEHQMTFLSESLRDDWYYTILINATTGMISMLWAGADSLEFSLEVAEAEVKSSYVLFDSDQKNGSLLGYWDENHINFDSEIAEIKEMLSNQLEESPLLQGADVVKIDAVFDTYDYVDTGQTIEVLQLLVTLSDNRTLMFYDRLLILVTEHELGEFPLKMFSIDFNYTDEVNS